MTKTEIQAKIDVLLLELGTLSFRAQESTRKIDTIYYTLQPHDTELKSQAATMSDELDRMQKEYQSMQDILFKCQAMLQE